MFPEPAHPRRALAYLQEPLTLGVAEAAHSNPVERNSKPSLRQLNHFPAWEKKSKEGGKELWKDIIGIIKVTTSMIPPFIQLTTLLLKQNSCAGAARDVSV